MSQAKRYTLAEIAELLEVQLEGDGDCVIRGLAPLADAGVGQLSFLSNPAYSSQLAGSGASAVILAEKSRDAFDGNRLISPNPYLSFARATQLFAPSDDFPEGIHPTAVIDPSAELGSDVRVDAHAVVGAGVRIGAGSRIGAGVAIGRGCRLGDAVVLHPKVVLYHDVSLGDRVVIHSATVIGADGFGFAFDGARSIKIAQLGSVRLGDDVEIGAASTIDRGALQDTVVGDGVKIDNHVQIGHNSVIGNHTVTSGCAALAARVPLPWDVKSRRPIATKVAMPMQTARTQEWACISGSAPFAASMSATTAIVPSRMIPIAYLIKHPRKSRFGHEANSRRS